MIQDFPEDVKGAGGRIYTIYSVNLHKKEPEGSFFTKKC